MVTISPCKCIKVGLATLKKRTTSSSHFVSYSAVKKIKYISNLVFIHWNCVELNYRNLGGNRKTTQFPVKIYVVDRKLLQINDLSICQIIRHLHTGYNLLNIKSWSTFDLCCVRYLCQDFSQHAAIQLCCITNISNMFLTQDWRLKTSSRLFYDFIKTKL